MTQIDIDARMVAKELVAVRQRGLAEIDLRTSVQEPLELAQLEALALRHTNQPDLRRVELIRRLLHDGLSALRDTGDITTATLLTDLFFEDGSGATVARSSPRDLLRAAERTHGAYNFERRRRARLREFATFLIDLVDPIQPSNEAPLHADPDPRVTEARPEGSPEAAEPPADHDEASDHAVAKEANPTDETEDGGRPQRRIDTSTRVVLVLVALAAAILGTEGIGRLYHHDPLGFNTPKRKPPVGSIAMHFNERGGSLGVVKTYAGVNKTATDSVLINAYRSGAPGTVICKLKGRNVSSNSDFDESPDSSDVWFQVETKSGQPRQYVSSVYTDVSYDAADSLQSCPAGAS